MANDTGNKRPLFAPTAKPDLFAKAKGIAHYYEASAFTDETTLISWIHAALEETWAQATRHECDRITELCRKEGLIK